MSVEITQSTLEQQTRSEKLYRYIGLVSLAHNRLTNHEYLEQQVVTELAESLDAEMGTRDRPIMLREQNGHIIDTNGTNMTQSADAWALQQAQRAAHDSTLSWFARMAAIEAKEHHDIASFSRAADVGDTMVVVSPFPEDIYADPKLRPTVKQEGFRPQSKRGFMRVYEKTDIGVAEHIQSVDNSSLDLWNAIFTKQALPTVSSREQLLSQRLYYKGVDGQEIIERFAQCYDKELFEQTKQYHRYGRIQNGTSEANMFVRKHALVARDTILELQEIPKHLSPQSLDEQANKILYNSKALLNRLFEQELTGLITTIDTESVRDMRSSDGYAAASAGKVYDGCSGQSSVSTALNSESSMSHQESFTIKKGIIKGNYEIVGIGSCPNCKTECIDGIRDKNTKKWVSCTVKGCKSYNQEIIDKIYGGKSESGPKPNNDDWFSDVVRFWGFNF